MHSPLHSAATSERRLCESLVRPGPDQAVSIPADSHDMAGRASLSQLLSKSRDVISHLGGAQGVIVPGSGGQRLCGKPGVRIAGEEPQQLPLTPTEPKGAAAEDQVRELGPIEKLTKSKLPDSPESQPGLQSGFLPAHHLEVVGDFHAGSWIYRAALPRYTGNQVCLERDQLGVDRSPAAHSLRVSGMRIFSLQEIGALDPLLLCVHGLTLQSTSRPFPETSFNPRKAAKVPGAELFTYAGVVDAEPAPQLIRGEQWASSRQDDAARWLSVYDHMLRFHD